MFILYISFHWINAVFCTANNSNKIVSNNDSFIRLSADIFRPATIDIISNCMKISSMCQVVNSVQNRPNCVASTKQILEQCFWAI
jgi:hypothetical protein